MTHKRNLARRKERARVDRNWIESFDRELNYFFGVSAEGLARSGFLTPRDRNDKLSIRRARIAAVRAAAAASDREVALKAANR